MLLLIISLNHDCPRIHSIQFPCLSPGVTSRWVKAINVSSHEFTCFIPPMCPGHLCPSRNLWCTKKYVLITEIPKPSLLPRIKKELSWTKLDPANQSHHSHDSHIKMAFLTLVVFSFTWIKRWTWSDKLFDVYWVEGRNEGKKGDTEFRILL